MSPRKLKKALKHTRKRHTCGCCEWIKAERKYRQARGLSD